MKLAFDVTAGEFALIRDLLDDALPTGCRAWVFGSRAKGRAHWGSDLDLALEAAGPLPGDALRKIRQALTESRLQPPRPAVPGYAWPALPRLGGEAAGGGGEQGDG